ncbi:exported hypothetical protein [Rhodococcus sp. RD6.2]|nr:exported hypothetical protein [Rhodococcus sp. RD6.2]
MVFSGARSLRTRMYPSSASSAVTTIIKTKTIRNAAQRGIHTLRSSARKKKKKKALKTRTESARMKNSEPCRPFFTSLVTSALASSTSARTRVETCAVASLTRCPMLAVPGACASTSVSGMDEMVPGTPFPVLPLRSLMLTSCPFVLRVRGSVRYVPEWTRPRRNTSADAIRVAAVQQV